LRNQHGRTALNNAPDVDHPEMPLKDASFATQPAIPARGFIGKILSSQRRKMLDAFMLFRQAGGSGTVLNVYCKAHGTIGTADSAIALNDPKSHETIASHPPAASGSRRGRSDERQARYPRLPFADGAYDWVICNEAIERSGGFDRQYALVKELHRVARKGVFITTSNRRHPVEFNTGMPLIHFLPDAWWRRALKWIGKDECATELNLLDARALYKFASLLPNKPEHDVGHKRVLGAKAHFFLMIRKGKV
jgi:hypothetical protein